MNKILGKIYGPLVVLVDVVLLIDIVSDLIQKRKARKAEKNNTEVCRVSARERWFLRPGARERR